MQQAAFFTETAHNILQFIVECRCFQLGLMIKPAYPKLAAAFPKVPAQMAYTAAF